jgi:predicted nucleotidyltransferase component of viral defense system
LDFSLVEKNPDYSVKKIHETTLTTLSRKGFDVSGGISEDKTVQKSFVRVAGLPARFGLSYPKNQKLAVKMEVDINPPKHGKRETFFVSKWGELFPILKYDIPTLFAGKVLAILHRTYDRGRDYYDLMWFLSHKIEGTMAYFKSGIAQVKKNKSTYNNWNEVLNAVDQKVASVDVSKLTKDIRPFLEDASDMIWLERYTDAFQQLLKEQPGYSKEK